MKTCSKCDKSKDATDYYKGHGHCKSCHNLTVKKWALANPEKVIQVRQKWRLNPENKAKDVKTARRWQLSNPQQTANTQFIRNLRKYGLTLEQYNQMSARQDYRCYLCGDDEDTLYVDHNHQTNKVRGLLCNSCNRGIGLLKDNSAVLSRAAQYVA